MRDVVRDKADMPRSELNNCKEDECSLLKQRFEQFSSVVLRLELELLQDSLPTMEIDELWRQRWILVRAIVATPAPTIEDALLKAAVVFSLVSNGELRIGLTPRCFEDYDRAIAVSSKTETGLDAPEPKLSSACRKIRDAMAKASLQQDELDDSWWREFTTGLLAIARYEAKTPAGLKLKGDIFQKVFRFASETDAAVELQMSYLRDFVSLATLRLQNKHAQSQEGF